MPHVNCAVCRSESQANSWAGQQAGVHTLVPCCQVGSWCQVYLLSLCRSPSVFFRRPQIKWGVKHSSPVCSDMCFYSPAVGCRLKAKECSEFKLTCQCEAYDAKSHELLRRCADLKWCKWLVRSSVIIITSYQIKKLEVGWQTDRWILTVKCHLMVMWSGRSLDKCGCNNFDWHYFVSCVIFTLLVT